MMTTYFHNFFKYPSLLSLYIKFSEMISFAALYVDVAVEIVYHTIYH